MIAKADRVFDVGRRVIASTADQPIRTDTQTANWKWSA
jgi:hypothetical protein